MIFLKRQFTASRIKHWNVEDPVFSGIDFNQYFRPVKLHPISPGPTFSRHGGMNEANQALSNPPVYSAGGGR
jgi:hypothetical protein